MSTKKLLAISIGMFFILFASSVCAQTTGQETPLKAENPLTPTKPIPIKPATPGPEQQVHFLQTLDYKSPMGQRQLEYGNVGTLIAQFDIIIRNGFIKEADAEMQRLAAVDMTEQQKSAISEAIFTAHARVLEHAEPLIRNGFFDYCLSEGNEPPQYLAYEYIRFFNTQKTVEDKLKAAAVFRRIFYPVLKARTKSKESLYAEYLLPAFSRDNISMDPVMGGTPPTIQFTYPPKALPKFSNTPLKGAGKEGKYLIIRKLKGGIKDVDYFIDVAMMSALPPEYFPEDLSKVTRIAVIDSQWKQDGKFQNGVVIFTPRSTIIVYDYASGQLIAKIGEHSQKISGLVMMRKDAKKYFSEVNKVATCKKLVDWLNKKPKSK